MLKKQRKFPKFLYFATLRNQMMTNDDKNDACENSIIWECHCGKIYKYRQGLAVHKKQCAELVQSTIQTTIQTHPIHRMSTNHQILTNNQIHLNN